MTRPSRTGGKTSKAKGHNASPEKGRKTTKTRRRGAPATTQRRSISDPSKDLKEARAQQAATAEILNVISNSPTDTQPVFDAIVQSGLKLFPGALVSVALRYGDRVNAAAVAALDFARVKAWRDTISRTPLARNYMHGAALLDRRIVDIPDAADAPAEFAAGAQNFLTSGNRAITIMPLMRGGEAIGLLTVVRLVAGPLSDNQIAVLKTFASQAVIAIENTRLLKELRESLQQQTATADVLKVISASPGELEPVFQALLENAVRLCEAKFSMLFLYEERQFRAVGKWNLPPAYSEFLEKNTIVADPKIPLGRVAMTKQPVQVEDVLLDQSYIEGFPGMVGVAEGGGARTLLQVPMLKDNELVGTIGIYRQEVRPFTEKQIALVQTFANQAVIAIENARLFDEAQVQKREALEALEHQIATSAILDVISRSPSDTQPVFDAIVKSAARLCDAVFSVIWLYDGELIHYVASHNFTPEVHRRLLNTYPKKPDRSVAAGRAILDGAVAEVPDMLADPTYAHELALAGNWRASFAVPMLYKGKPIGAISLGTAEAKPFSERQIQLLKTFADQAVIAIENARLFNETREALERQTATGDVLKIISRSSVDLETVLETLVETVARLCRADQVYMFHLRHDLWHLIADYGLSIEAREFFKTNPFTPGRGSTSGRAAMELRAVSIADVLQDPEYTLSEGQAIAGYRSTLGVPLLREDTLIGVFSIVRTRVEPFASKDIELATSFADQAVIAIENARLFDELRERQAELRVTFDNMGDAVAMFGADKRLVAWNRNLQDMLDLPDDLLVSRPNFAELFRYLAARGEFGSSDLEAELARSVDDIGRKMRYERVRPDGRVVEVRRNPVPDGGFVLIYADITERKRSEDAVRMARDAAEKALLDLQAAQDRLVQTEKLASLGQLTAGIAHEIKNPLNFVNNFSALSFELTDELNQVLKQAVLAEKIRQEVDDLTQLLKSNLEKVVQHGRRADSIVKNMLLHSREGSGELRAADINGLVEESLNLAYHGARAEKSGFNITLQRQFDATAGEAELFPQEITRALLNLISNGFYAATKRKSENGEEGFEPTLSAATRNLGASVEIRIRDNGTGIPADVKEKIFNPFFTTKPAGEGTGLGLSMTHDIIVKQHGGTITVDTKLGAFTEFVITLPRATGAQTQRSVN